MGSRTVRWGHLVVILVFTISLKRNIWFNKLLFTRVVNKIKKNKKFKTNESLNRAGGRKNVKFVLDLRVLIADHMQLLTKCSEMHHNSYFSFWLLPFVNRKWQLSVNF